MNLADKIKKIRHDAAFPNPNPQEFVGCWWALAVERSGCHKSCKVTCGQKPQEPVPVSLQHCRKYCGLRQAVGLPTEVAAGDAIPGKEALVRESTQTPEVGPASPATPESRKAALLAKLRQRVPKTSSAPTPMPAPAPVLAPTKIACVVSAWNEGPQVYLTCSSLIGSVVDARNTLRVFAIDDGSTDQSFDRAALFGAALLVRHDESKGVGVSWNEAADVALAAGMEVVGFYDAHMRFPPGSVEVLSRKAIESGAVIVGGSTGFEIPRIFAGYGCDLKWTNDYEGIEAKWMPGKPEEEWKQVPAIMGACYVMSRETIERLKQPTGRLWEGVVGRWGYLEEGLSLKAALLDIPILVSRDVLIHHLYRKENPVPGAGTEKWKNVAFSLGALFSAETFEKSFRAMCEKHLPRGDVMGLAARGREGCPATGRTRREELTFLETTVKGFPKSTSTQPPPGLAVVVTPEHPMVSCLTVTYGRFAYLRCVLACFMAQTYPHRELIILNKHPVPIRCNVPKVRVFNEPGDENLGDCRNRTLSLAGGYYVRTWDDDDLYLPWTLEQGVAAIGEAPAWKPARSWFWHMGQPIRLEGNVFEASMLMRTDVVRKYGYKAGQGDEHMEMLGKMQADGGCAETEMGWESSYVYTWGTGLGHASGTLGSKRSVEDRVREWKSQHQDSGNGKLLTPAYMVPIWKEFMDVARPGLSQEDAHNLQYRLERNNRIFWPEMAFVDVPWHRSFGSQTMSLLMASLIQAYQMQTCIEIGLAEGFTTAIIAAALAGTAGGDSVLLSCDNLGWQAERAAKLIEDYPIKHRIVVSDSAKVDWKEELKKEGREQADLCMVDGDHSEVACYADLEACDKVLRPGGFMVCHDYKAPFENNGVEAAITRFCKEHDYAVSLELPLVPVAGIYPAIILQKK